MDQTPNSISESTTHDLWVEARKIDITISRPTPTSINLEITRPTDFTVTDGMVVILDTATISSLSYPVDGVQYTASTDFTTPADKIGHANVVGFYSNILAQPMPTTLGATGLYTFNITITNTDPNTLYYASVHAATNVLQYYPIGVQSYPLESSRREKDTSAYTGSIPQYNSPPENPTSGRVS